MILKIVFETVKRTAAEGCKGYRSFWQLPYLYFYPMKSPLGGVGGSKYPVGQEIGCHFLQEDAIIG